MGVACHDVAGRTLVALGNGGPAQPIFSPAVDVPGAGVLCAIPALVANGLFHNTTQRFPQPPGYYPLHSLILLFSLLALARIKSLERVRYLPPGEWGRMLGLDRIPEAKTMREKLDALAQPDAVAAWAEDLSSYWMRSDENMAGILYVDGHIRAYTGSQTELPRRFSTRERLCVRSLIDYWVNDRTGSPYFVVTAMGTEGMLHHMRTTIIPRLLKEVPNQPSEEQLAADPALHRFVVVFDREGWSPAFFAEMWREQRIAILTYRKGKAEPWAGETFVKQEVPAVMGNVTTMHLAEKEVHLPALAATDTNPAVRAREIRRLCDGSEHQTSIITTIQTVKTALIASHMFSRWSQENFFKYGTRELAIDHLPGNALDSAPGHETIRNPAYNRVDASIRRGRAEQAKIMAQRGRLVVASNEEKDIATYLAACAPLDLRLTELRKQLDEQRAVRKGTPKRLALQDIPEDQRPQFIAPARTQFLNSIRITAYRAETAMAILLRGHLARNNDARATLQTLFTQDADLLPDYEAKTLTVRVHHCANPQTSRAVQALLEELTQSETLYPGTTLTMRYEMVSLTNPAGQDV